MRKDNFTFILLYFFLFSSPLFFVFVFVSLCSCAYFVIDLYRAESVNEEQTK